MKKLIAAPFAAVLLTAGLSAVAVSPATAAEYPGSVATDTEISADVDGKFVTFEIDVNTAGNATPGGRVKIVCDRDGDAGFKKRFAVLQAGEKTVVMALQLAGEWDCTVTYIGRPGDVFKNSSDTVSVDIRKG